MKNSTSFNNAMSVKKNTRLIEFTKILDSIDDIDDKKKKLWKEIYENATVDRENAYELYTDIADKILEDPLNHATYGSHATKYLERVSKANDQLIKLAELIASAEKETSVLNTDEVFERIISNESIS